MSEPTRYSPAGDGVVRTDPKGPLINHYYYEQLKAENATLEAKVKRMAMDSLHDINHIADLKDENARLKAEVEMLKGQVRYWQIEAECDHGRWLRCLEDLEKLRGQGGHP